MKMEEKRLRLAFGATPDVPQWINIVPMGRVTLGDGRDPFDVDREALEAILTAWEAGGNDLVIDYEHQTLEKGPAPAAGWIKTLEAREDGLWARVEWTEKAQAFIANREYRYFSPVLMMDDERQRPVALLHAALTNFPAINHLTPLVARSTQDGKTVSVGRENPAGATEGAGDSGRSDDFAGQTGKAETEVLSGIKEMLGLGSEAGEAEVLEALKGFKTAVTEASPIPRGMSSESPPSGSEEAVGEEKGPGELCELRQQVRRQRGEVLIREALTTGRTSPEELNRAGGKLTAMAHEEPETFRALILGRPAQAVIPLGRLDDRQKAASGKGMTQEELRMCKLMGLDPQRFAQHKSLLGAAQGGSTWRE